MTEPLTICESIPSYMMRWLLSQKSKRYDQFRFLQVIQANCAQARNWQHSTTSKLQKDASWRAAVSPRLEKKINQSLEHHYKSTFIAPTQNHRATRCSKYTLCWPPFHFNMAFPLKPTVVFLRGLHWCEGIPLWIISGSFHAFVFVCCFQRTAQAT